MSSRRKQRKERYKNEHPPQEQKPRYKRFQPRSMKQQELLESIKDNAVTFGIGAAGTGKTYVAVAAAVEALKAGDIKKIIITRPAVEAGEKLGFLPGTFEQKLDVYLYPIYDAMDKIVGKYTRTKWIESGELIVLPIAYMRGITIDNCVAILDEAQNTTKQQLKMVLTRLGKHGKLIINGDPDQNDIVDTALLEVTNALDNLRHVGVVKFDKDHVVRHAVVKDVIDRLQ